MTTTAGQRVYVDPLPPGQPRLPAFPSDRELHGIRRGVPPGGPERLLAVLVMRGLNRQHHQAAAALCLALDQAAHVDEEAV